MVRPCRLQTEVELAGLLLRFVQIAFFCLCLSAGTALAKQRLLSEADRATYTAAFEQIEAEEYGNARLLAGKAENPLPGKIIRWLDLTRARDNAEPTVDFAEAELFIEESPNWPRRWNLLRAAERAIPRTLSDQRVRAWFEDHPPVSAEGVLRFAHALIATGKKQQATKLIRDSWVGLDFTEKQELSFRQRYHNLLTRDDEIARLDRLLWKRAVGAARRQAGRAGASYVALADARLRLAGMGAGVDQAIKRVPAKLQNDPGLLYDRALWRQRKGRIAGVIELLDPPRRDLANPDRWWSLKRRATREALDLGKHQTAYRIASQHGIERGIGFAEGEWLAGWIALRFVKHPERALEHFARLYNGVSSPISLARGAYWAGEAAAAKGADDLAAIWYRRAAQHSSTYYGQLAARRLGQELEVTFRTAAEPSLEVRAIFERREIVYLIRLLGDLEQKRIQARFLHHLRESAETGEEFRLVTELAVAQGRPDIALRTAKDARLAGFVMPEQLYPRPNLPETDGLEPALVMALIRQESQFYTEAVSRSGARGLMQLMPATAKLVAKSLKLPYQKNRLTEDPAFNMQLGTTYLARLLDRFDGSVMMALAGYNAGPHRVEQWIKRYGDPRRPEVDAVDWAESIPFSETRNYVQRILETIPVYQKQPRRQRASLPLEPAATAFPATN